MKSLYYFSKPSVSLANRVIPFATSLVLHAGLAALVYFVGMRVYQLHMEEPPPEKVVFMEYVPRTLGPESTGGNDATKPSELVADVLPARPAPDAPDTMVKTGEGGFVPSRPDGSGTNFLTMGPGGSFPGYGTGGAEGTGIIGDRSPGGRENGIARHGGTPAAENAVKAALRWLAAHQDADGKWSATNYTMHCPPGEVCEGPAPRQHSELPGDYNVGVSSLALLSFLGHGNTHKEGEFKETAGRALDYLLTTENARTGAFGQGAKTSMYNQAIATLCLAEAYAMSKDEKLHGPLVRAIGYIYQAQQRGGGWDYTEMRTDRNDTSVTGWQVMALKSAHAAGFHVPWKVTYGILNHFERVTDEEGYVGYIGVATSRYGLALTAVGMLSNEYMGLGPKNPVVQRQAGILLDNLPAWYKLAGESGHDHSMYYWYYGTLAMYQKGGADWDKWNNSIRDMLVRAQCSKGHARGSWDPDDYWGRNFVGRIYSTALMALTLEIYYRYLPMYESNDTLAVGSALAEVLRTQNTPAERVAVLKKMMMFTDPKVGLVLRGLLTDENPTIRYTAAKFLVERGDTSVMPVLVQGLDNPDAFTRFSVITTLEEVDRAETIPALIRALADPVAANGNRAESALVKKTGVKFGLGAATDEGERRKIIASWEEWWKNNGEKFGSVPDISGSVVASRGTGGQVLVKVNAEDPIKDGMQFRVYREGKLVGHVTITEVLRGGMAEGLITHWELPGQSARQGDRIATRHAPGESNDK